MGSMNDNVDNMRDTISSGVGDMANAAKDGMDNLGNLAKEKILDQNGGLGITTTVSVSCFHAFDYSLTLPTSLKYFKNYLIMK